MLYLVFAIIMSTAVMVVFRMFTRYGISNMQAIAVNYVIAAWASYAVQDSPLSLSDLPSQSWFIMAVIIGISFIIGFNLFALSSQKAGVAITGVSSRVSAIIPAAFGLVFLNEDLTLIKGAGILLVLVALYLIFKRDKSIEVDPRYVFFPILLFLVNGANDTMMSYTEKTFLKADNDHILLFLSVIFATSLVFALGIVAYNIFAGKRKPALKNLWGGIILGLLNFGSTYYFLKAISVFEVSVVVPVQNVSIVSLSALTGFLVFKEHLRKINWLGIIIAIIAIFLIATARTSS